MNTEQSQLLSRKDDLVDALRTLERDHETGIVDAGAYERVRNRFESEAATILERLEDKSQGSIGRPQVEARRSRGLAAAIALGGVLLAIVLLMVGALRARGAGESITGSLPPTVSIAAPISPAVRAAEKTVSHHLRNSADWTRLGQAQLTAGDVNDGTVALRQAMRLDSHNAEAPTALAISQGSRGHVSAALGFLARAESAHPGYARAWFADGLFASRTRATLPRAIASWKRFLGLQPHSVIATEVRTLLKTAERVVRR